MKKHDRIGLFNPDVPDENFFIFPNLLIVEKKPFPEADHLRNRLIFYEKLCNVTHKRDLIGSIKLLLRGLYFSHNFGILLPCQ